MKAKQSTLWITPLIAILFGVGIVSAQAAEQRYRYHFYATAPTPDGFTDVSINALREGSGLTNNGFTSALLQDCNEKPCFNSVATYDYTKQTYKVLQSGVDYHIDGLINKQATVAGTIIKTEQVPDYVKTYQKALFYKDHVEYIPALSGENYSDFCDLNDKNAALVVSYPLTYNFPYAPHYLIYKNGRTTRLDFGTKIPVSAILPVWDKLRFNDNEVVIGTYGDDNRSYGFRFDSHSGKTMRLDPLPTEPFAIAVDINNNDDVLGYSRGDASHNTPERIGIWNKKGDFVTYFVENTATFPTVSSVLAFNDNNEIVVSGLYNGEKEAYLIPRPGVRWTLSTLIDNLPKDVTIDRVLTINNAGDMIGIASQSAADNAPPVSFTFMLKRS